MADEAKKQDTAGDAGKEKIKKKKMQPTNCAQSNKRIRRKDWYYRDGKYFANKQAYKLFVEAAAEKASKAKEASAQTADTSKPAE